MGVWFGFVISIKLTILLLWCTSVAGDTCLAMDEWVQNPIAHTALDDILPCVDAETAQDSLSKAKDVTYQVLSIVNLAVDVSNADPGAGPLVPLLCNPFFASVGQACPPDAVDLKDATQVNINISSHPLDSMK